LVDQAAHRCADLRIAPNGREQFFSPVRIDFHVVIDEQKIVVSRV